MTYRTSKPLHPTEFGGPKKTFRSAFSSAKKSGKKTFTYKGKPYTTQTAQEKAKKSNAPHLVLRARKAAADVKKNPSKSNKEIYKSYEGEVKKRFGGRSSSSIYRTVDKF